MKFDPAALVIVQSDMRGILAVAVFSLLRVVLINTVWLTDCRLYGSNGYKVGGQLHCDCRVQSVASNGSETTCADAVQFPICTAKICLPAAVLSCGGLWLYACVSHFPKVL